MAKMLFVIVVDINQDYIDELGFSEWLKKKREELSERFNTNKVFIVAL